MIKKFTAIMLTAVALTGISGCASMSYESLPVHVGTIIDSSPSMRREFTPSLGGAAAGAAVGGLAGNRIGKGNGRKAATVVGLLAGAAVGGQAAGSYQMVPISIVTFRDNITNQHYHGPLDGQWVKGMAIRYSVTQDGTIVLR